ncbi:Uncharacterised protein [Vibrio cholerae]|nr:Uncharacterised protein [Vibrio cholerae]
MSTTNSGVVTLPQSCNQAARVNSSHCSELIVNSAK